MAPRAQGPRQQQTQVKTEAALSQSPGPWPMTTSSPLSPSQVDTPCAVHPAGHTSGSRRKSVLAWPAAASEKRGMTNTHGEECGEGDQKAVTDRDSTVAPRFGSISSGLLSNNPLQQIGGGVLGWSGIGQGVGGGFHPDPRALCPSAVGHSPFCCCLGPCPSLRMPCAPAFTSPMSVTGECRGAPQKLLQILGTELAIVESLLVWAHLKPEIDFSLSPSEKGVSPGGLHHPLPLSGGRCKGGHRAYP